MQNVIYAKRLKAENIFSAPGEGGGGMGGGGMGDGGRVALPRSYDSPHGKAPSERGTFLKLQFYQKVSNSRVEKYDCVGKSVI